MSALGQNRTYAVQNTMSALPPIATAKADMPQITPESGHVQRNEGCPLWAISCREHVQQKTPQGERLHRRSIHRPRRIGRAIFDYS
jgi:hypothetical protein